jgi:hypothetical protein
MNNNNKQEMLDTDSLFMWFAANGNIRKWDRAPFPEGVEYIRIPTLPDVMEDWDEVFSWTSTDVNGDEEFFRLVARHGDGTPYWVIEQRSWVGWGPFNMNPDKYVGMIGFKALSLTHKVQNGQIVKVEG